MCEVCALCSFPGITVSLTLDYPVLRLLLWRVVLMVMTSSLRMYTRWVTIKHTFKFQVDRLTFVLFLKNNFNRNINWSWVTAIGNLYRINN